MPGSVTAMCSAATFSARDFTVPERYTTRCTTRTLISRPTSVGEAPRRLIRSARRLASVIAAGLGETDVAGVEADARALTKGLATDFAAVAVLPRDLRATLAERLQPLSLTPVETFVTPTGDARKTLFQTPDGHAVEAVLMAYRQRATVCVSSQVGCSVGCAFCASGSDGLKRSLSAEEMVDQVLHFARGLRDLGRRVTNVVFMGMGEPFLNYDETLRACRLLCDPEGFGLGARGVSISTAGVEPAVRRFTAEESQINLAVSLHAATDALRDRLVPLNRRYPLDALFAACRLTA